MAENTKTFQVELSENAMSIFGTNPEDIQDMIELIAGPLRSIIDENGSEFRPQEWRAMAFALRDVDLSDNRKARGRLAFCLIESDEVDSLSGMYGIDVGELIGKLKKLGEERLTAVVSAIRFGLRRYPTRLDSYAWWTVEARSQGSVKSTNSPVKTDGRRKENRQNKDATSTKNDPGPEAMTGRSKSTPPAESNGQQNQAVVVT